MDIRRLIEQDDRYIPSTKESEGHNTIVIRCFNPDHEDRNPSMIIYTSSARYWCPVCQFNGNLAEEGGFSDKIYTLSSLIQEVRNKRQKPSHIAGALTPTNTRGITDEIVERFELFTAPEDHFLGGRLCIPIKDVYGQTIAYSGRVPVSSAYKKKYLCWPAHAYITPQPMYVNGADTVVLVEGMFDMLRLQSYGYAAVCLFGLSTNKDMLSHYHRQGVNNLFIMFDNDEPGIKAAQKIYELAAPLFSRTAVISLDTCSDPDELTLEDAIGLLGKP